MESETSKRKLAKTAETPWIQLPYKCPGCPITFKVFKSFVIHELKHHPKIFKCEKRYFDDTSEIYEDCLHSFDTLSELMDHHGVCQSLPKNKVYKLKPK